MRIMFFIKSGPTLTEGITTIRIMTHLLSFCLTVNCLRLMQLKSIEVNSENQESWQFLMNSMKKSGQYQPMIMGTNLFDYAYVCNQV